MSERTPTPWKWQFIGTAGQWSLVTEAEPTKMDDPYFVQMCPGKDGDFIVRACNAHDALVEALEEAHDFINHNCSGKFAVLMLRKSEMALMAASPKKVTP